MSNEFFELLFEHVRLKLLFVRCGFARIATHYFEDTSLLDEVRRVKEKKVFRELKELGFIGNYFVSKDELHIGYMIIANTQEDLFAFRNVSIKDVHQRGLLFGIPDTAIHACQTKTMINENAIPVEILNHPFYNLLYFRFSINNYAKEWNSFLIMLHQIKQREDALIKEFRLQHFFAAI